jgi:IS5 family transposase
MHPRGLLSLAEHMERPSKDGDPLDLLAGTVEFERFRPPLVRMLGYSDGTNGGRLAFDPVALFKVLVAQAQHYLSSARVEFMIRDRLSWMRFFGFDLGDAMPDDNTMRHYRGPVDREQHARCADAGVRATTA